MVNTADKGRNNELLSIKIYERLGFTKYFRSFRVQYQQIDFGPFDMVLNKGRTSTHEPICVYVSSKSNGSYGSAHIEEVTKWAFEKAHSADIVELHDHYDGKWKFDHVECKHKEGCKGHRDFKITPAGEKCPKCGRVYTIRKTFISPFVRITRFFNNGRQVSWDVPEDGSGEFGFLLEDMVQWK
jgi:hypothetical protein